MKIESSIYQTSLYNLLPNIDKSTLDKFLLAYKLYKEIPNSSIETDFDYNSLSDELLSYLFNTNSNYFAIPMSFINSPVGTVLFSLKFSTPDIEFTTSDIRLIANISRSLISYDYENNKIIASKLGRNIVVSRKNLITYLSSKGMRKDESKERISSYLCLRKNNATEDKILDTMDQISIKYKNGGSF